METPKERLLEAKKGCLWGLDLELKMAVRSAETKGRSSVVMSAESMADLLDSRKVDCSERL